MHQHPKRRIKQGQRTRRSSRLHNPLILGAAFSLILGGACLLLIVALLGLLYGSGDVLPGVSSVGVDLGGMSEAEAADALNTAWNNSGLQLRDGVRLWAVSAADLGITLDTAATAAQAQAWGRSDGGFSGTLRSFTSGVEIEPVLSIDLARLTTTLESAKSFVDLPPTNAGVNLVNGQVVPRPAVEGRVLNTVATAELMRVDAAGELADGALDLIMSVTAPTIIDASPLVAQANALLTSPFTVNAYDPVRDEWHAWSAPPEVWSGWLAAETAPDNSAGLSLALTPAGPTAFLQSSSSFGDERYIEIDQAVAAMQEAATRGQTSVTIRVWHHPTSYAVQSGQTLASIAEEVGIPYPYLEEANPEINVDALTVGQMLTLPSKDILVPLNPIPSKRIVVSRSQQHLWAYENGQILFDWVISTGLPSSPTALGVFQVQTHEPNAYADQWNLYMPHFMGFYHPGPNMDLMNGFHGFPTRGGGYLLWSDDLGHPVTYGCVLLSLENAETLYNWAEEGVVVEVRA
jgi:lipoprotein-anchoring transpeptidase ErfK/SrfK